MKQIDRIASCLEEFENNSHTSLKSLMTNMKCSETTGDLIVPLGVTENEEIVFKDFSKIPHILISGTTGSGKTTFIQSLISAITLQYSHEKVKFLIFDSKMVDYGIFNSSANLLVPVIINQGKVAGALGWLNSEVNHRIKMKQEGCSLNEEPEIFLIIDDYSDLSNNESVINELFNLLKTGRLVKIHCIISTSTPTAKIISTELKENIPCRIAFKTVSKTASRMILDENGAETLKIPGEIIFKGQNQNIKCQCLYVKENEISAILKALNKKDPEIDSLGKMAQELFSGEKNNSYEKSLIDAIEKNNYIEKNTALNKNISDEDPMLNDAIKVVIKNGMASTSILQRNLKLGYARAARLIDIMEERGIVGPYEGSKPREVLITKEQFASKNRTVNTAIEKDEIVLKPFPLIESLGASIQINNHKIIITKPITVNGISGRKTYTFSGNMLQQLIYKKAGILRKGHITFVVVAENMVIRENGIVKEKISVNTPSVPVTINFNKNNDPIFYKLISQVSKDVNIKIDLG